MSRETTIAGVTARALRVPAQRPESDGTLSWDATTVVVCEIEAAGRTGLGYTYASPAAGRVIEDTLRGCLMGADAFEVKALWVRMRRAVRNLGEPGIAAMAISAADMALWDLLARLVGQPLHRVLGRRRRRVAAYGSGGFTSYSEPELEAELEALIALGLEAFKIKVGREPERDVERVRSARRIIGPGKALYVDANGAYTVRQALELGEAFADLGVSWYEEPVTSDDTRGLAWLRRRCPPALRIAAGEYGFRPDDFKRLLDDEAVDVLMIDATRCGGVTGFSLGAALAAAYHVPVSTHCAPTIHRELACSTLGVESVEYFHDHVRVEHMLFDGAATVCDGTVAAGVDYHGIGMALDDAAHCGPPQPGVAGAR